MGFKKLAFFFFACQDVLDEVAPPPTHAFKNDASCLPKILLLQWVYFFIIHLACSGQNKKRFKQFKKNNLQKNINN